MEGVTYCILYIVFPRWEICSCYLYNALCVELDLSNAFLLLDISTYFFSFTLKKRIHLDPLQRAIFRK